MRARERENALNIVRFQINTPAEIILGSPQGTVIESRYGDQVMFTLADGRIMYVPGIVATRIQDHGIRAGEPFDLCKILVKNGRRRSVDWLVKRRDSSEQETQVEVATFEDSPPTPLEQDLRASRHSMKRRKPRRTAPRTERLTKMGTVIRPRSLNLSTH
jgi:hypothetical protein